MFSNKNTLKFFVLIAVIFLFFFRVTATYTEAGLGTYLSNLAEGVVIVLTTALNLFVKNFAIVKKHPVIAIALWTIEILLILSLVYLVRRCMAENDKKRQNKASKYIKKSGVPYLAQRVYKELSTTDSAFNQSEFQDWIKNLFVQVQNAWSKNDISQVQHFLSDGLYEQLQIQINLMKEKGIEDYMEDLEVYGVTPINLEKSPYFQVLHIQIGAAGINYRKNKHTGDIVDGDTFKKPFGKIWSLVRRCGSTTNKQGQIAIVNKQCPNCGTPLSIERVTSCPSCSAVIRSGSYSWVLAGITQASLAEFAGLLPARGVKKNFELADDPNFNEQLMRDIGSVMFWRNRLAEYKADGGLMGKVASPAFIDKTAAGYKRNVDGLREVYTKIVAGGIGIAAIASDIDGRDYVMLNITWQGILTLFGGPEELYFSGSNGFTKFYDPFMSSTFYQAMVLSRKHAMKTKVDFSLSSAACSSCGAPQTDITASECPYCGYIPKPDSGAWFLEDILAINSPAYKAALKKFSQGQKMSELAKSLNENFAVSPNDVMKLAILLSLADGTIADSEMQTLKRFAKRCGIFETSLLQMVAELKKIKDPERYFHEELNMPKSSKVLKLLLQIAIVDGVLEESEMNVLRRMARVIDYSENDLQMMIRQERNAMMKMGKQIEIYVNSI